MLGLPNRSTLKLDELADGSSSTISMRSGATRQAHNVLSDIKRFYGWALGRGGARYGLAASPAAHLKPKDVVGSNKNKRKRALDDQEIRRVWSACCELGYPYGPLYLLLIVTGQRKLEVGEAVWPELKLDKGQWIIPATRMKMDSGHLVPLSDLALEILESLPQFKSGQHLFSSNHGRDPVNGYSKNKVRLDKLINKPGTPAIEHFIIHDLRRTTRTRLSELGVERVVAERVIAHAPKGLDAHYDMYEFSKEKAEALQRWADKLRELGCVPLSGGKVVQLHNRRDRAA